MYVAKQIIGYLFMTKKKKLFRIQPQPDTSRCGKQDRIIFLIKIFSIALSFCMFFLLAIRFIEGHYNLLVYRLRQKLKSK